MALKRSIHRLKRQAGDVDFGIAERIVPVELWEQGGANRFTVTGALTIDGQPVGGAWLTANTYTVPQATGDDGTFTITGDQTVLDRHIVRVKDASQATVAGAAVTEAQQAALRNVETTIETAFVMTFDEKPKLAEQGDTVISGTLTFADGTTPAPSVRLWGYYLTGMVVDADGHPVEGAYVSVRDDEGETWALSDKTGADGRYTLRFFPIGGSEFILRVARGVNSYQAGSEIAFEDATSAKLDIMLHEEMGMVVGTGRDGAFEVEPRPGAEYVGYMAGVAAEERPLNAAVTWPEEDGRFTVTIPESSATDKPITFFQARLRFFSDVEATPGGEIAPDVIPDRLDPRIPDELPPIIE